MVLSREFQTAQLTRSVHICNISGSVEVQMEVLLKWAATGWSGKMLVILDWHTVKCTEEFLANC